jgi:hypothetical protein
MMPRLVLAGLDGGNPLAFLAALGVLAIAARQTRETRVLWVCADGRWRPVIHGVEEDEDRFIQALLAGLELDESKPFSMQRELPFGVGDFVAALNTAVERDDPLRRRLSDLLAGLGTDGVVDEKGRFADTALRMVRSKDAAGQGLLAYAMNMRKLIDGPALRRALFEKWRYEDSGFALRWDPIEDDRYGLRWYDPGTSSNAKFALRTMQGANVLALEGLALLPVQPGRRSAVTTGFGTLAGRREYFTWPIWDVAIGVDVVRSLLALEDLQTPVPDRGSLACRGVVDVYRSERIAPNKYYKNFSPAVQV